MGQPRSETRSRLAPFADAAGPPKSGHSANAFWSDASPKKLVAKLLAMKDDAMWLSWQYKKGGYNLFYDKEP